MSEDTERLLDCAWEEGVCLCPACGAVVRIVPRLRFTPHVVDVDGRAHYCERYIAAALSRHGVPGMSPILEAHARRPIIDRPQRNGSTRPPEHGGTGGSGR